MFNKIIGQYPLKMSGSWKTKKYWETTSDDRRFKETSKYTAMRLEPVFIYIFYKGHQ